MNIETILSLGIQSNQNKMLLGKLGQDLNTIRKSFMSGFICWGGDNEF